MTLCYNNLHLGICSFMLIALGIFVSKSTETPLSKQRDFKVKIYEHDVGYLKYLKEIFNFQIFK